MWVKAKYVTDFFQISNTTLSDWSRNGKIERKPISGSRYFLYNMAPFINTNKKHVIYARVSTSKQKNDLDEQIKILRSYVAANGNIVHDVFSDIGSGLNEKRSSLISLIDLVTKNEVDSVYISYKDRLSRFGFGYLEYIFSIYGTKIVVINSTEEKDFQTELSDDLVAIIHHFSMKMYSNRRKELQKLKKYLENQETPNANNTDD